MRPGTGIAILLVSACSGGCLARQVAADGNIVRNSLQDMYTDQALDNLVRAYEDQPFVQLTYSQLSVNDKDALVGNVAGGEADFGRGITTDLSKTGAAAFSQSKTFSGKFPFGGSGRRDRVLSFHADPVTDQNYVYEAYLAFAKNPGLFMVSTEKPTCPVYIVKKWQKKWYWIPTQAGPAFLQLVLDTSFIPPTTPPEDSWDTTIIGVDPRLDDKNQAIPGKFVLTLSKGVPNDAGLMRVTLRDGRKIWLPIFPVEPIPGKVDPSIVAIGQPTKKLYSQVNEAIIKGYPPDVLSNASGLFLSASFPNLSTKPAADAQKVLDLLDNIRIQLTKPNS